MLISGAAANWSGTQRGRLLHIRGFFINFAANKSPEGAIELPPFVCAGATMVLALSISIIAE